MARRTLAFEPGTKWQYSPGLSICGRIVEVASGQPYEEFVAARILRPLQMDDTTFFPTPAQQPRLAVLYQQAQDTKTLVPAKHWLTDLSAGRTANPSGGLFSTASDLFRFYQMVLNGGELDGQRIVSQKSVADMTRVQTGSLPAGFQPGSGWGLGWGVVREPQGQTKMLSPGTYGHGGAFGTQGWVDPQRQMVLVLLIQRTGFGGSDTSQVREAFQQLAVDAVRQ
jgi:CubicO group peptidase (beta-lactamase class C family)